LKSAIFLQILNLRVTLSLTLDRVSITVCEIKLISSIYRTTQDVLWIVHVTFQLGLIN